MVRALGARDPRPLPWGAESGARAPLSLGAPLSVTDVYRWMGRKPAIEDVIGSFHRCAVASPASAAEPKTGSCRHKAPRDSMEMARKGRGQEGAVGAGGNHGDDCLFIAAKPVCLCACSRTGAMPATSYTVDFFGKKKIGQMGTPFFLSFLFVPFSLLCFSPRS